MIQVTLCLKYSIYRNFEVLKIFLTDIHNIVEKIYLQINAYVCLQTLFLNIK